LYLDGELAATGEGETIVPTHSTWTNGFFIGSDNNGYEQARGAFLNMETWEAEFGGMYTNGWLDVSNAIAAWQDTLGGGGFGRMMGMEAGLGYIAGVTYTTNYADYASYWLTIGTSSSGTQAVFTVQNTLSNLTYNILTNSILDTNLAAWGVWQTLTASNSVIVAPPFNIGSNSMFFAAQLVLSTTTNSVPDWWAMKFFGTLNLNGGEDFAGLGLTIAQCYQFGADPNIISFIASVTNQYVPSSSVPVRLNVTGGLPAYMATMVDSTNFTSATWSSFNSNLVANVGTNQGWHKIYVGLKGLPADAVQTWHSVRVSLASVASPLVVTNLATNVTQSIIQIQGCCATPLASISYDMTNSAGLVTNQQAFVTSQYYDTNVWAATTNYFQCFDVPLALGLNTATLRGPDLAGNSLSTTFRVTYSLPTDPPVVQLYWPTHIYSR